MMACVRGSTALRKSRPRTAPVDQRLFFRGQGRSPQTCFSSLAPNWQDRAEYVVEQWMGYSAHALALDMSGKPEGLRCLVQRHL